mmetsp:Transcript_59079/g.180183  ORF Transcript_59079/g.180183 Transcript_59079/m.180183 type:complete len:238 (-) Transcript_59079:175-888(-)
MASFEPDKSWSCIVVCARAAMWSTLTIDSSTVYRWAPRQLNNSKMYLLIEKDSVKSANATLPLPVTAESTPKCKPPRPLPPHLRIVRSVSGSAHSPMLLPQRGARTDKVLLNMTMGHWAPNASLTTAWEGGGVCGVCSDNPYMMRAPSCMSYGTTPIDLETSAATSPADGENASGGMGVASSQLFMAPESWAVSMTVMSWEAWNTFFQGSGVGAGAGSFSDSGAGVARAASAIWRFT